MAMVGSLTFHADDDLEDSDFFEQLANDLGNGDLGHLQQSCSQEGEASFDEVFSTISVSGEGSALAPPASAITEQNDGDNPAGDDFWLEENLIGEPSHGGSQTDLVSSTSADLQSESVQVDAIPGPETPSPCAVLQTDAIPALDAPQPTENSIDNVAFAAAESPHQPENSVKKVVISAPSSEMEAATAPGNSTGAESSAIMGSSSYSAPKNLPDADDTFEMEQATGAVIPEGLCSAVNCVTMAAGTDVSSSCISSLDAPELNLTDLQVKEGPQQSAILNSPLIEDALTALEPGDGIPNAQAITDSFVGSETLAFNPANQDSVQIESVDSQPASNDDHRDATEGQPSANVRELQWSSFGGVSIPNTFGSFSDFLSDLDSQTGASFNYGMGTQSGDYQGEPLMGTSLAASHQQKGWSVEGESLVKQAPPVSFGFYGAGVEQCDETGFWNQPGEQVNHSHASITAEIGEQQAVESKESGLADVVSEAGGGDFSMGSGNYEAQPQGDLQQSWENMYPGWYFDYASNEWKQTEGWDSGFGSLAVEEQVPVSSQGHLSSGSEEVVPSHTQTTQIDQVVSTSSGLAWQSGQEQASWSALGSVGEFGTDMQAANNDQYNANNDSGFQQQFNCEEQYPGWYYDYQAQEWRQIAGNSQTWSSNQDSKLEASQVANGLNSSPLPEGEWTEIHAQSHYQSELNQNIYWPERSQSSYNSGGDVATFTRGMSFNSWAEPAVALDASQQAGAGTDNMKEALQSGNAGSWMGFQGDENTVSNYNYHSQTDYNLTDKAAVFGNPQGFFQPHNAPRAVIEGVRSSAGRPLHALVAFGFGGKLVTMKAARLGTPEPIVLHDLNQLVLTAENCGRNDGILYFSALNRQGLAGPLVGHGVTSKELLKWVDERIENCELEDPYCTSSEALRILWGVLKIACLHYGKLRSLVGSAGLKSQVEDGPEVALGRLLAAAKNWSHWNQGNAASSDALHAVPTEHQLQATAVEVRRNLMDGKRKEALQLAQQGQLWGPALVIAWQLGEKVYGDTVLQMAQQQFFPGSPLRTLLLLFAGQTTELFKPQSMPLSAGTPGPYLPVSSSAKDSAGGMLGDWLGNLSIIAANPTKGDEQVITHLGDSLWKDQGEVAGAHSCYLVAEASFESFSKKARLCLVGADHFKYQRTFATPQAIQRTELYEYAKVLGNPQYILVPFQPYKLLYAHMLAEAGKITEACRYCQMVIKGLKNAGRASEIEFCKQSALALEDRLRLHSQGGYSLNFSTGKLVGKVMGTIDSTIHKIIGGPPLPPVSQQSPAFSNAGDWYMNDQRYGNTGTPAKATALVPSASNSNLVNVNSQVDVPTRSVSEPNLSRSPTQEVHSSVTSSKIVPAPPKQLKSVPSGGGYLGRFGSQFLAKAVGFMKPNKKEAKLGDENKFYYDEKLKRWVEAGAEQSPEEVALPPPPIAASFSSSFGTPLSADAKFGGETQGQGLNAASLSSSSDLPPMPPSVNQFSARGRLHGVRSRYVDTFNKGNTASSAKSTQSPIVPTGGWGMTATPSQFFAATSVLSATDGGSQMLVNGHLNDFNPEFLKSVTDNSTRSGHLHTEHEPLLPKNLSSSFMAVPLIPRHSSASNVTMLTNNELATREDKNATHGTPPGNITRAVSWSGESPNATEHKFVSSGTYNTQRLPNISRADTQMEVSLNFAAAVSSNSLPSPPVIEPPASYTGFQSSQVPAVRAGNISQGGVYGEMQEVDL